ncbi:hypothetical protein HYR99_35685 [Candidatus Poribacteria bacterium]|nr:hypothetical protein [Candidatus Poribacteria bacterium]
MQNGLQKISPVIFGLTLICFFLPFINVSCQGQKVATFTGIQLVKGTTIQQPSMFGERPKAQKVDPELLAILAFLSAIVGLGLSFLKGRQLALAPAIVGIAGLILLLLLKSKIDHDALREGRGMLQPEYDVGFWLSSLLFLAAAGVNGFIFLQGKQEGGTS